MRHLRIARLRGRTVPILKKHRVRRAALSGSAARGEAGRTSGIDILFEPPAGPGLIGENLKPLL